LQRAVPDKVEVNVLRGILTAVERKVQASAKKDDKEDV
jgi:tRNA (cytidine32/uridine32-2'-O)-methyltransferase